MQENSRAKQKAKRLRAGREECCDIGLSSSSRGALIGCLLAAAAPVLFAADAAGPFGIHIVDEASGRGVPLVTLETTDGTRFITDSAGWVAFDEPGVVGKRLFFKVAAPGYAVPGNALGLPGSVLDTRRGGTAEIKVMRASIAEWMYRTTGAGIYRDASRLGVEVPLPRPNLNGDIVRHGAVQAAVFHDRVLWTWREATGLATPRAVPHAVGAFSDLPAKGGLDPVLGVHFDYVGAPANGPAGALLHMTEAGAVRLDGLLTARDRDGAEHLLAHYTREDPAGRMAEHGIAEFNTTGRVFEPVMQLGEEFAWQCPHGHAVRVKEEGVEHFYFGDPFLVTRVPASYEDVLNPSKYESLVADKETGAPVWRCGGEPPLTQNAEAASLAEKGGTKARSLLRVTDVADGRSVLVNGGTVRWNAWRKRWVMIASGTAGEAVAPSALWYAESLHARGPWKHAVRIADDSSHALEQACHHEFFDQDGGRLIYFEALLAPAAGVGATPRYDGNQMMFRLDLGDRRLEPARTASAE